MELDEVVDHDATKISEFEIFKVEVAAETSSKENDTKEHDHDMTDTELWLPFNEIVENVYKSKLSSETAGFIKNFCYIIAKMLVRSTNIKINHQTMLMNVSKADWQDPYFGCIYGIDNAFDTDESCTYCSKKDSGNCVDLLLDLQHEYTIETFICQTPSWWGYTCPVTHAYLWVYVFKC